MLTKGPKGTKDVIPEESYKWHYIEGIYKEVCESFGYKEIRTPVFEHTNLFERGVGETTDVVQKEMYTFKDKGGRSITLKPEGTSSIVRSFVENKLYGGVQPTKVFYNTPCFRYERPQAGRLRAFHQFGVEVFGSDSPSVDVEVMSIAYTVFERLGLKNIELNINSVGCPKCRAEYNHILKEYIAPKLDKLCNTCNSRYEKNPLRILDCKNPSCQEELKDAPLMIDHLCDDCREHFDKVKEYLDAIEIDYIINPKIVRGLDYYTKTAFEFISKDIGAQGTVCGGGRYNGLVKEIGGPETAGIGFGMGVERLLLTLESLNIPFPEPRGIDIFIVTIGERADIESFSILYKLRKLGISADKDHLNRSIRAQFKYANKIDANFTIVIGDDELDRDVITLKNMKTGDQREIKLSSLTKELKQELGR